MTRRIVGNASQSAPVSPPLGAQIRQRLIRRLQSNESTIAIVGLGYVGFLKPEDNVVKA